METHVSSTTADVRDTQEVIGADGNVELVITVEKIEEDSQHKSDSDSQDNVDSVLEKINPDSSQHSTDKEEELPKSPPKQDMGKEVNQNKTNQLSNKVQLLKQSTKSDGKISQNKSPEKQQGGLQKSPTKESSAPAEAEATSSKDVLKEKDDDVENKDNVTLDDPLEGQVPNDSQTEAIGDASEKEHNKSISRELKSLINSAKESKIISECTKLTTKTRKSRAALDTSNTNTPSAPEGDKEQSNRRNSNTSQKSNTSEKSEKVSKRSMRSQNPEFVHKVKRFLNSVTGKFQRGVDSDASSASDEEVVVSKNRQTTTETAGSNARKRKISPEMLKGDEKGNKLRSDPYCWRCHLLRDQLTEDENMPVKCTVCPRSFHCRCLTGNERAKIVSEKTWVCPECLIVLQAESADSRSTAMKRTSVGMLQDLLKYALQRMKESSGAEPFLEPVDRSVFRDYDKYVVHPMDLTVMKENVSEGLYGSTEAFLADAHWILHNSIIFNTPQSKLTTAARAVVRSCRTEMGEIEACPECYLAAHARRPTWFTDVCTTPHMVLWAKLKGFPYWPAKAMSVTHAELVDVRFFGAHDRAWVPARDCFLYCEKDPNNFRTKRADMIDSMQEAEQHIRNISRKYGKFVYAPYRTVFEPSKMAEQLKLMIPSYDGPVRSPIRRPKTPALGKKSRSNSKSSKDDSNIGDILSDTEPMDDTESVAPVAKTNTIITRKRKISDTKDTTAAVPDSSPKPKRRFVDSNTKDAASASEAIRKLNEALKAASEELIIVDCDSESPKSPPRSAPKPDVPATRATPNKHDAVAKATKATPKTAAAARPPNKTPAKADAVKINEKAKGLQEESTVPQNQKNSKQSDKSLTNIETIEVDDANTNSTSTNKTMKQSASNTETPTAGGNKANAKEAAAPPAPVEKGKIPESAVLIKITDKQKDSTQSFTINVNKNKSFDTATLTKIAKILNPDKNKEKQQENENKDVNKEKAGVTATAVKTVKKTNAAPNTLSGKNPAVQKSNENAVVTNKTAPNEKPVEVTTTGNDQRQEKEPNIETTDQTTTADKRSENNTDGKKDSPIKDKTTPGKGVLTPKASTSKVVKVTKVSPIKQVTSPVVVHKDPKSSSNNEASTAASTTSDAPAAVPAPSAQAAPRAAPSASPGVAPSASPGVASPATRSTNIAKAKPMQITVEATADSSIFTPTSTDNVRNMKEAVSKLQKLKSGMDAPQTPPPNPQVGRVGVRSFARMTSPEKTTKQNEVLVEIKSEPMDFEETEVQEDATVLNALRPRPIAPAVSGLNLREVRISKVMPASVVAKKGVKVPDIRPRAKKTFPQPKKPDDGRAELTSKNSMVYIPIQGPVSQAQVRAIVAPTTMSARPPAPALCTNTNVKASTMGPPLLPMAPPPAPPPLPPLTTTSATATVASGASVAVSAGSGTALAGAIIAGAGFPTVPTNVHTVPLITSVNGQWTFSLQPVMSVGAGEQRTTSPSVNGLGEKTVSTAAVAVTPTLVPAASAPAVAQTLPPPLSAPAAFVTTSMAVAAPTNVTDTTTPTPAVGESIMTPAVKGSGERTVPKAVTIVPMLVHSGPAKAPPAPKPTPAPLPTSAPAVIVTNATKSTNPTLAPAIGERKAPNAVVAVSLVPAVPAAALASPPPPTPPPALAPAGATTDAPAATPNPAIGEPPALTQRPVLQHPLASGTEIGDLPAPSAAGPLTAKLNQNSIKLAEFFRKLLEDSLTSVEEPSAETAALRLQLEQERWHHQHALEELRHTHDLLMMEVRSALEKEKTRAVAEARRLAHQELEAAVKEAKSKQWCSNCGQEAQFYCCWNTSYCDYPCQRAHWSKHFSTCTQQRAAGREAGSEVPPLLPPPADRPKSNAAPKLSSATKVIQTNKQQSTPAVEVTVEDASASGNGQLGSKSVTPSPQPSASQAVTSLNKKLINKEESGKRVVTSGGYLIVGGSAAAAAAAVPPDVRRLPRQD